MATPHGDRGKNLNTGFIEFATAEVFQDAQVGSSKSHTLDFHDDALGSTSSTFHSSLEPSILSIFGDSSAEEAKIQIDEESEASLLSAFSEMLDSVIEDTLSPFDTLPDSKLFMGQSCQDSRMRLHCLDREAVPGVTKSFTLSSSKAEAPRSDRQLRPRLHRRTPTASVQRSDGEEEDLIETRRRPVRIFRIESDAELCQDEQKDRFVMVSLVDLVRHMHPYSLRVAVDKKESLRDIEELQEEEDVFVDVVGDEDTQETVLGKPLVSRSSDPGSEQVIPALSSAIPKSRVYEEDILKVCSPNCGREKAKGRSGRVKKTVRFAPDLASIHVYQVEDEAEEDSPDALSSADVTDDLKLADSDSQTPALSVNSAGVTKKMPSRNGNSKLKTLSLQEYRLLRQKTLPKEERKIDYKTKWPSVPETPTELPPIPCIPGYNSSQVNVYIPSSNSKTSTPEAAAKSRRNLPLPLKSPPKQTKLVRKPVQVVDPPNPVTVSLQPDAPPPDEQKVTQQEICKSQANQTNPNSQPDSVTQEQLLKISPEDAAVKHTKCSPTVSSGVKGNVSVPSSPVTVTPVQASQGSVPRVQIPVSNQSAKETRQESAEEKGIEATDVTSLLEQFETQGLTPPATPPHQIWKPLTPTLKTKQHEAPKPSPNKTIQIIEPKPLPPSKIQSKPRPSSSIPAPSLFLAFIDHDYCGTQDFALKKREFSHVHKNSRPPKASRNHMSHTPRTRYEAEQLSGSVLLSPESSPCRVEARRTGECREAERHSCCSCSPSPPARGRARRRHYRRRYRPSDSSSVSSSRSPSCSSSASSCSPPRKRYRSLHSESSSSSSSRSSSRSLSPSPIRGRRRNYRRSQSRSFSRSRSRSPSPQPDWRQKWSSWKRRSEYYHLSRGEDTRRAAKQKAIDERRVVYVGRIRGTMTKDELRERFAMFGKIEDCTVHFRSHGDNYGFVTYYDTDDAFTAIEKGTKLRQPDELPFDICFGGRRQFCQSNYMDLDSNRDMDPAPRRSKDSSTLDFDTLLKQAQRGKNT
ncbi:peroxisome proliferator-activated receptor gamma coactivator-related protein 1-like [Clarias magur]|uniref:Peroxisome proliferator-activated receptor gamma coactivator-related protein 1-like n=1 Tax=Clarias magur TaxID=1594786 RepID=A0A8J4U5Q4_CLAMG|nr:peroxisome proliferator-activated receptor gamma coactivator-related protein 1-like [Clarias magur]